MQSTTLAQCQKVNTHTQIHFLVFQNGSNGQTTREDERIEGNNFIFFFHNFVLCDLFLHLENFQQQILRNLHNLMTKFSATNSNV